MISATFRTIVADVTTSKEVTPSAEEPAAVEHCGRLFLSTSLGRTFLTTPIRRAVLGDPEIRRLTGVNFRRRFAGIGAELVQ